MALVEIDAYWTYLPPYSSIEIILALIYCGQCRQLTCIGHTQYLMYEIVR